MWGRRPYLCPGPAVCRCTAFFLCNSDCHFPYIEPEKILRKILAYLREKRVWISIGVIYAALVYTISTGNSMEGNKNKVVAEVSVVPLGTGKPGVSEFVAACVDILSKRRDLEYRLTSMGTIVEGTIDVIFSVVREMHEVPFAKGALRVVTTLKIDDRRDKSLSLEGKIKSVRTRLPSVKT